METKKEDMAEKKSGDFENIKDAKDRLFEEATKYADEYVIKKFPNDFGRNPREFISRRRSLHGNFCPTKEIEDEWKKRFDEYIEEKKQLNEAQKQIEELTDTLKRLQAEFENFKKRIEKEKIEFAKYANAGIISGILPVIDSFEFALKHSSEKEKFVDGIKMIYAQLYSTLEAEGLHPIKTEGEKFDPYKHEVLMKEESDKPEGTILEELQKGYMLNDKVLRFSKVKISGK